MIHPMFKLFYIILGIGILYYIFPHLVPFLLALVLAVVFEPVVEKLQKNLKVRRIVAVTANFLLFVVVAGGLAFFGSTKIIHQLAALLQQLPDFAVKVGRSVERLVLQAQVIFEDVPPETVAGFETAIREAVSAGSRISTGAGALVGTARAIPEIFVVSIVTLVSFYLFSLQLHDLRAGFIQLFSERARTKVEIIIQDVNRAIVGFVRAQFIISFITYLFIVAGLLLLDIGYALAVALLIVLVDVLPILGTGFVMLPWATFLFIMGERFTSVGIIILYLLIIVLRRIIEPKILGQNIGLSPLSTVISMYVGFKVLGLLGIFLGPAIFIVIKAMRKAGLFRERIDF